MKKSVTLAVVDRHRIEGELKQPKTVVSILSGCAIIIGLVSCFHQAQWVRTLAISLTLAGAGTMAANEWVAGRYAEAGINSVERELQRQESDLQNAKAQVTGLHTKIGEWEAFWSQQSQQIDNLRRQLLQAHAALSQAQADVATADNHAVLLQNGLESLQYQLESCQRERERDRQQFEQAQVSLNDAAQASLSQTIEEWQHRLQALQQEQERDRQKFEQSLAVLCDNAKNTLDEAIREWQNGLMGTIIQTQSKNPDLQPRLQKLQGKVTEVSARYLGELAAIAPTSNLTELVDRLLSLLHHATQEFSSLKVQYRNALSIVQVVQYQAEIEQLQVKLENLGRDTIPRQQHEILLQNLQSKKDEAIHGLLAQIQSLKSALGGDTDAFVQGLISQLETAQNEVETLQNQVGLLRKPKNFTPATRDDLRMGNLVIAYFEALGVILDRAYSDYKKWEAYVYFHVDRNNRMILPDQLNDHSDRLHQLLHCLNVPKFEFDAEQGLMKLRIQISGKPKEIGDVHKLWRRATEFEEIVKKWERVRVTGGSESGKSPTAENIAVCILKNRSGSIVKLSNPQDDSKKNNWSIPSNWTSHKESVQAMEMLAEKIRKRSEGEESRAVFELNIFDEVDTSISKDKSCVKFIKDIVKEASHQNLGAIFIGQNANAKNYVGFDRSDWNNAVNVHIGGNAYDAIKNSNFLTSKEQTALMERADRLTEFCEKQNQELGFESSDPEAYRFALVIVPSKRPFYIELPQFGQYSYDQILERDGTEFLTETERPTSVTPASPPVTAKAKLFALPSFAGVTETDGRTDVLPYVGSEGRPSCPHCGSEKVRSKGVKWSCENPSHETIAPGKPKTWNK